MNVHFAFGTGGLDVDLPAGPLYNIVESRSAQSLADVASGLDAALDRPIGCASLLEMARGRTSAAIAVCDITRPAPNRITLPPLLQRLHEAGIPEQGITILIATGLHRAATPEEIRTILGPEIAARYRVVNHDARVLAAHRPLGATRRGTPIFIDERFMDADLHITLGFIEPHLMLGFSGGRKLIAPGLAAQETIKVIHSPGFMRDARATEGSIENNPLHAELLEIARIARHDFMLDVTLTKSRAISGIFAGSPVAAHAAGIEFLRDTSIEQLDGAADVVITSGAGRPLDLTFYQTIKGITAAAHIAKPRGRILMLGECAEGVGSPEFTRMLASFRGCQEYLDSIRSSAVEVDQWQLEKLALVGLEHELFLFVPGVPRDALGVLAARSFATADRAIAAALHHLAPEATVALVPEGPYAFARVV